MVAPVVTASGTLSFISIASPVINFIVPANSLVVLAVHNETPSVVSTVLSIHDTLGLTWAKRSAQTFPSELTGYDSNLEVWWTSYGAAAPALDTITVTHSQVVDDGSIVVFSVAGANTSSPWDANGSLPARTTGSTSTPTISGISTTSSEGLLLLFGGSANEVHFDLASGFSQIAWVDNGGGVNFSGLQAQSQAHSSALSGASATLQTSWDTYIIIADAIVSGSPYVAPIIGDNFTVIGVDVGGLIGGGGPGAIAPLIKTNGTAFTALATAGTIPAGMYSNVGSYASGKGIMLATYIIPLSVDETWGVLRSTDGGATWAPSYVGTDVNNYIYAVTFGNGIFVGVGQDAGAPTVFTSADGVTWTNVFTLTNSATPNQAAGCTFCGGKFFVGQTAPLIAVSSDGVSWSEAPVFPSASGFPGIGGVSCIGYVSGNTYMAGGFDVYIAGQPLGQPQPGIAFSTDGGLSWGPTINANGPNLWGNGQEVWGVAYGDGIYVAAGEFNSSDSHDGNPPSTGVSISTDGVTWTPVPLVTQSFNFGVAFDGSSFLAAGFGDVSGNGNVLMTSPDGVIWTAGAANPYPGYTGVQWGGVYAVPAPPPPFPTLVPCTFLGPETRASLRSPQRPGRPARTVTPHSAIPRSPPPAPKILMADALSFYLFEFSCHLYTSPDGAVWTDNSTPSTTLLDNWSDMTMAVNDGDHTTVACWDQLTAVGGIFSPRRGGLEVGIAATLPTQPIIDYSIGSGKNMRAYTGAITANGAITLTATSFPTSGGAYPRLSTNSGATWSDVTGVPANLQWRGAAFSANAAVMYLAPIDGANYIQKSVNGGATWTPLSSGPLLHSLVRLRCSADGSVIGVADFFGFNFGISTDGGATWAYTDFQALSGYPDDNASNPNIDFGMSLDGSTFFVVFSNYTTSVTVDPQTFAFLSQDAGATWRSLTIRNANKYAQVANCSPAGNILLIAYAPTAPTYADGLAEFSLDTGDSWTSNSFALNAVDTGGLWVSAYVFGPEAPPPTLVPCTFLGPETRASLRGPSRSRRPARTVTPHSAIPRTMPRLAPTPSALDYIAYIYDDCCHVYSQHNGGAWADDVTNQLSGDWNSMTMAVNDGDYSTMVSFLENDLGGSPYLSGASISFLKGVTGTWSFIYPTSPGVPATVSSLQQFAHGAISGGRAAIILALPSAWTDVAWSYPRISRDAGATWSDVTAVGSGRNWTRACFGAGGTTMYVASGKFSVPEPLRISASFDTGATWADVTPPPTGAAFDNLNGVDMACSADGNTLLYATNWDSFIYVSHNRGTTWAKITPPLPAGVVVGDFTDNGSGYSSCGMSPDGRSMVVAFGNELIGAGGYPYNSYLATSADGGVTWTFRATPKIVDISVDYALITCNVSPDGSAFVAGFQNITHFPDFRYYADISTDSGSTWVSSSITPAIVTGDDLVSSYIFSSGSPPPPPTRTICPFIGN